MPNQPLDRMTRSAAALCLELGYLSRAPRHRSAVRSRHPIRSQRPSGLCGSLAVLVAAAVAACIAIGCAPEAEAAKKEAEVVAKLIAAIETSDYGAFLADGEPGFKDITPGQFQSVTSALGPKLRAGKSVSYLGDLKQRGYRVTLWKIAYHDGSDDGLATLSMKDGKVGGFIIR